MKYCLRDTLFGQVAMIWKDQEGDPWLRRIILSRPGIPAKQALLEIFPHASASSCGPIHDLGDRIVAFLGGEEVHFPLKEVGLDSLSFFQAKVLRAEHAIPRGRVSTYRLIAGHLGNPGSARAVGSALANNPFPIVIPCHRAIRSDGALGGYQGGLEMKRALLEMEGVAFRDPDHVLTCDYYYGSA